MGTNIQDIIKQMPAAHRKRVEERTAELMAAEMNLQALRRARKLTQARLAKKLGISQDGVSRLEKRTDLLLSTLRSYIEGMGGKLSLVAEFPNREKVIISELADT